MRPLRWAVALALLAGPLAALQLPEGATRVLEEREALGSHRLVLEPWAGDVAPGRDVEGAVTREVWQLRAPGTTLELLAPLRDQLEAEGFAILLDCEAEACGGFDFRQGVEVLPAPAMFVDLADFRYLSAEKDGEALSLLVSRGGGTGFVQVVRVTPPQEGASTAAPQTSPAPQASPPPDFAARLEADGRVVLEGLAFATGSDEIAAGGEGPLEELAAYLSANPSRRVALVGHTDAQGSLSANIALSKERAEAVVDRLVETHGASPDQLQAEGMGWLAPRATNLTPEGREANRRVEVVVLP